MACCIRYIPPCLFSSVIESLSDGNLIKLPDKMELSSGPHPGAFLIVCHKKENGDVFVTNDERRRIIQHSQGLEVDLLPREDRYDFWENEARAIAEIPKACTDQNFLEAGHHFGINTLGESLRDRKLKLGDDPIIPKIGVSPFFQSAYAPDTNRRFFEVCDC